MNEQDPLSQLRDIHLPDPGGFWPPAPGWWLLTVLLLLFIITGAIWLTRKYRRNRWLKAAHAELNRLQKADSFDSSWFGDLNSLLKRCARQRYPDQLPQSLSGSAWVDFLLLTGGSEAPLSEPDIKALVAASWQPVPECDPAQAIVLARQWLRRQRC